MTIFYFSATGNSLDTALKIAQAAEAQVLPIAGLPMNYVCPDDQVGFVFPVFAWGLPNMVHSFIKDTKFNKNAYFFAVGTCGISAGKCFADIDELLKNKGAHLSYGIKLRMVANYIAMYDVKVDQAQKLLGAADKKLAKIIEDIKNSRTNKFTRGLPIGGAMHRRFSVKYPNADKDFNVSDSCTMCGLCEQICPAKNIIVSDKVSFLHRCEHCMACVHWCPAQAINYKDKTQNRRRYHHPNIKSKQLHVN